VINSEELKAGNAESAVGMSASRENVGTLGFMKNGCSAVQFN